MRRDSLPSPASACWARAVMSLSTGVFVNGTVQFVNAGPEDGLLFQLMPVSVQELSETKARALVKEFVAKLIGASRSVAFTSLAPTGGSAKRKKDSRVRFVVATLVLTIRDGAVP